MKFITLEKTIALTAFIIAGAAAYFSVTGIGKLFAGAMISAIVMASALELGKLVSVSFLYRYWSEIPKALKRYLLVSSLILMVITSLGIYGYLSSAYATVAADPLTKTGQISMLSSQDSTLDRNIKLRNDRLNQLMSLRSQQETRLDGAIQKTTTGNSRTVRDIQASLKSSDQEIKDLQKEISDLSKQSDSLNSQIIKLQTDIKTDSKIGTFIYISDALGMELDDVVKWFILIIVFVFDPLSISLILAYNFLKIRKSMETKVILSSEKQAPITISESNITTPQEEPTTTYDPYFTDPNYDWGANKDVWTNDQAAINYYNYIKTFGRPNIS